MVHSETSAGEASQAHFSGSLLASNPLVQPLINSNNWASSPPATAEGYAVTDGGGTVASLSRQAEAVHLAPGVERVLSQCSAGVRNTVMSARAPQHVALMPVSRSCLSEAAQIVLSTQLIALSV